MGGQNPLSVVVKPLAEGEGVDLGARIEEGNREGVVGYRARLTDELGVTLVRDGTAGGREVHGALVTGVVLR